MRELFIECPPLLLALFIIKAKTFILRLKFTYLLFERRILVRRQREALLENGRRAMLVDKAFDFAEKRECHVETPNAALSGAGHEHHRKRCAVSPRPPRTHSYVALIASRNSSIAFSLVSTIFCSPS